MLPDNYNLIKVFQDALAEKYGFNDKKIYKWDVEKIDVSKGEIYDLTNNIELLPITLLKRKQLCNTK